MTSLAWISEENKALLAKEGMEPGQTLTYDSVVQLTKKYPSLEFEDILTIVKYVDEDHSLDIMNMYCYHATKLESVQSAFEFASSYRNYNLLLALLDKHQHDDLLTEWCQVYELVSTLRYNINIDFKEVLAKTEKLLPYIKSDLLITKLKILRYSAYYRLKQYKMAHAITLETAEFLKTLRPGYLKSVLAARVANNLAYSYFLFEHNVKKAELLISSTIVNPATQEYILASAHQILGQIYIFNNFQKSKHNLIFSYNLYKKMNVLSQANVIKNNDLIFLHNVHQKYFPLDEDMDIEEQAHQYIIRKQPDKAIALLDLAEQQNGKNKFNLFYRSMATDNYHLCKKALHFAMMDGDFVFTKWMFKKFEEKYVLTNERGILN